VHKKAALGQLPGGELSSGRTKRRLSYANKHTRVHSIPPHNSHARTHCTNKDNGGAQAQKVAEQTEKRKRRLCEWAAGGRAT